MENYDDIINMEHHISKRHMKMSMENRAAQFSPFSALTGYEDAIKEVRRLTSEKKNIDEDVKEKINRQLLIINKYIDKTPTLNIIYFVLDKKKSGGKYMEITGNVKKIDMYNNMIYIDDKKIFIHDIIRITSNNIRLDDC